MSARRKNLWCLGLASCLICLAPSFTSVAFGQENWEATAGDQGFEVFEIDAPPSEKPATVTPTLSPPSTKNVTATSRTEVLRLSSTLVWNRQGLSASGAILGSLTSGDHLVVLWRHTTGKLIVPHAAFYKEDWTLRVGEINSSLGLMRPNGVISGVELQANAADGAHYTLAGGYSVAGGDLFVLTYSNAAGTLALGGGITSPWRGLSIEAQEDYQQFRLRAGLALTFPEAVSMWKASLQYSFKGGYARYQNTSVKNTLAALIWDKIPPESSNDLYAEYTAGLSKWEFSNITSLVPKPVQQTSIRYQHKGNVTTIAGSLNLKQSSIEESVTGALDFSGGHNGWQWNWQPSYGYSLSSCRFLSYGSQFKLNSSGTWQQLSASYSRLPNAHILGWEAKGQLSGVNLNLNGSTRFTDNKQPSSALSFLADWAQKPNSTWYMRVSGSALQQIYWEVGWRGATSLSVRRPGAIQVQVIIEDTSAGQSSFMPPVTLQLSNGSSVKADSQGRATFSNVAPGEYTISVNTAAAGEFFIQTGKIAVTVESGKVSTVQTYLAKPATLLMRVAHDTNGNSHLDSPDHLEIVKGIAVDGNPVALGAGGTATLRMYPGMHTITAPLQWSGLVLANNQSEITIQVTSGETATVDLLYVDPVVEMYDF